MIVHRRGTSMLALALSLLAGPAFAQAPEHRHYEKAPEAARPSDTGAIMAIAPEVLAGDIAARREDYDRAVAHLDRAVRLEDGLVYTEPAEWNYPVRQLLAAVLLEAGRRADVTLPR